MAITQDDLDAAALEPLEVEGQAGRFKNRPIDDLLKAQDRAAGAAVVAAGGAWGSVSRTRVVLPGTIGPTTVND